MQKEGRGAITDADIFSSPQQPEPNHHHVVGGKALALGILKKAAASKQNNLLRSKGFGIILTKQKNAPLTTEFSANNRVIRDTNSVLTKQKNARTSLESSSDNSVTSDTTSELTSCDEHNGQSGQSSSLSLLGGYGVDSSDSD